MIALLLIPFALAIFIGGYVDSQVEEEAQQVAERNGLGGFDDDAPSIYDNLDVDVGTNQSESLNGSPANDALFSLGQADVVRGFDGNDVVEAGTNADTVFGGDGNDILGGGTGFDRLIGGEGDDLLLGNNGDDVLLGRDGDDTLVGGGDADTLKGGAGDDVLISGLASFGPGEVEEDLSATAAAAIQTFSPGTFSETDFSDLLSSGAFNGTDIRFLSEDNNPTQGGELDGGPGDDYLVLTGGDRALGGDGNDTFVLSDEMVNEQTVFINDFNAAEDVIALEFDGDQAPDIEVRDRDEDAVVFIGEEVIARIQGGAGLTAAQIRLLQILPV